MEPLFLPVLHSFENNNIFTGSYGRLRFRVTPNIVMLTQKEVNFDESSMKCECWHGEYCYEKSQMEDEKTFPLNEAAYHEMYDWISKKQSLQLWSWQHRLVCRKASSIICNY